jgi:NAD(P)-dependent dehydrogenase (short-subunit alcohol dehydrogenase family)
MEPQTRRVAVVTGGGRGLGRAYCEAFADAGYRVVVADLGVGTDGAESDEDPAADLAAALCQRGAEAVAVRGDVGSEADAEALIARALEQWGAVDAVVNNAGIGRARMLWNLTEDDWTAVMRVHVTGTFLVTRAAARWWRDQAKAGHQRSARLINTGTAMLTGGGSGQSNYVAAKAAIVAFTEAAATELGPYGVTANCVFPTAGTRLVSAARAAALGEEKVGDVHVADPSHTAALVVYLSSPEAGWISGQTFNVWGSRIERIATFNADRVADAGTALTPDVLRQLVPRLYGAGPHPRP